MIRLPDPLLSNGFPLSIDKVGQLQPTDPAQPRGALREQYDFVVRLRANAATPGSPIRTRWVANPTTKGRQQVASVVVWTFDLTLPK